MVDSSSLYFSTFLHFFEHLFKSLFWWKKRQRSGQVKFYDALKVRAVIALTLASFFNKSRFIYPGQSQLMNWIGIKIKRAF
jgi:hypothetical protein